MSHSRHLFGAAADIAVVGRLQKDFCFRAKEEGFTSVIPYGDRGFVHLAVDI